MEQKILEKVESLRGQMMDDILELVRIDSVETEAQPGAPFGSGVRHALQKALEMGEIEGAMSSLAIAVAGLITVVGASVFAQFL